MVEVAEATLTGSWVNHTLTSSSGIGWNGCSNCVAGNHVGPGFDSRQLHPKVSLLNPPDAKKSMARGSIGQKQAGAAQASSTLGVCGSNPHGTRGKSGPQANDLTNGYLGAVQRLIVTASKLGTPLAATQPEALRGKERGEPARPRNRAGFLRPTGCVTV